MGFDGIFANIEANGGNGLVSYRPPNSEHTYQLVIIGKQVIAVTLDGEYQPRIVAEKVVQQFAQGRGEAQWVPFPAYYPPLHLMFFIPFKGEEGKDAKGTAGGGK